MIFVGNYAEWIQDDWIHYLLHNVGDKQPSDRKGDHGSEEQILDLATHYGLDNTFWYTFTEDMFPFNISCPFAIDDNLWSFEWQFVKLLPGNVLPIHKDIENMEDQSKRYWMPLQDWEPGHIYVNNNEMMIDYKKGDVFLYDFPQAIHGSSNIGYSPRLAFNFIQDKKWNLSEIIKSGSHHS